MWQPKEDKGEGFFEKMWEIATSPTMILVYIVLILGGLAIWYVK